MMNVQRILALGFGCIAAALLTIGAAGTAPAQIIPPDDGLGGGAVGGVYIDAAGVVRTRLARDPSGQLMRQRVAQARASLDSKLMAKSELRKVSLNRLEAVVAKRIATHAGLTDEIRYLAGLTRIQYVFFYPETGDIVIAGPAEGFVTDLAGKPVGMHSGRAVLELQDLVVALRAFGPDRRASTSVISVSIDPTPEGLRRMQEFLMRIGRQATPAHTKLIVDGLRDSLGLQTVTLKGVPPKTHFAEVLVEADYRMKLIGIGLEQPPVRITSYVSRANPASVSRNALQRWYFVPEYECVRVSVDDLAMELVGNGVKLISQDEMVTADGGVVRSTVRDRASEMFVTSFTALYPELAARVPVYAQLRNLIDLSIAAAYIQDRDLYGKANWRMQVFGDEAAFPVETGNAPRHVETAVNAIWKGNTLMTPVGGGVHIQPRQALRSENLLDDPEGKLESARKTIDLSALAEDQWWWD